MHELLFFGRSCSRIDLFLDAGCFALFAPEVKEPGPADISFADQLDLVNAGGQDREDPFNTYAVRYFPDGEGFTGRILIPALDHNALELLDPLLVAFADLYMHVNGIAGLKIREICLPGQGFLFEFFNFRIHDFYDQNRSANICNSG